jgi:hypothetical protein
MAQAKLGEPIPLDELSEMHDDDQPKAFADFIHDKDYGLSASIPLDKKTLNKFRRFTGRADGPSSESTTDLTSTMPKAGSFALRIAHGSAPKNTGTISTMKSAGEMDQQIRADHEFGFLDLDEHDQWDTLGELDSHTVTGWNKRWEIVNSHFTKDAAEAFIRRKQQRIYVESQYYAWEFNAIKEAILDGTLTYTPKPVVNANEAVSMEIVG